MKVGILGVGGIAKKMAVTLARMEEAKGYAVASRDKEKAEAFAAAHQFEKAYGSYEELAADDAVDLIYIATPHSHHYEHAKLCIQHGKAVLCEKAFTANADQARELVALAKEKGVFLTEAIWTRYMPSRTLIDEIIAAGEIGTPTFLTANLGYRMPEVPRIKEPELAGGALLDIGIYPLHFASMFFGNEIAQITSSCTKLETGVDAQNAMILTYRDGKMAVLHSGVLAGTEQSGVIYGTKGYLIARTINNISLIEVYDQDRNFVRAVEVPPQITGYEYEVRACAKALREGALFCEEIPQEESIFLMEVMDQLREQWGIRYPFE